MNPLAIEVHDLVKVYHQGKADEVRALDGLSLEVKQGEIFGLLGPNGAGKSTLLKILTTLIQRTSGNASIMGFDVEKKPLDVRKNICVVLQQNAVEQYLSVQDNFNTFGRFHGLTKSQIIERTNQLIDLFGLHEERHQKVIDLSGGYKRRVQVAKVFMIDAPVIFLDEATTGMDPINKRATLDAIASEAKRGRTILLTTHILDEAEELCNNMMFINKGKKLIEGDLYSIKSLAQKIFDVNVTFNILTDEIKNQISRIKNLSLEFIKNTALLKIDTNVISQQEVITSLLQMGHVVSFEVHGATLEDIFVQLLSEPPLSSPTCAKGRRFEESKGL